MEAKKPPGWGIHSSCPYYKKVFADQIKVYVDKMIQTKEPIIFRYATFSNMSAATVYNRVNQSLRFLVEQLDDKDFTYYHWRALVNIRRISGLGVRIEYPIELLNKDTFQPDTISAESDSPMWRRKMDEWLESDNKKKPFSQENMALTPTQVAELREELKPIRGIIASVTSSKILIMESVGGK